MKEFTFKQEKGCDITCYPDPDVYTNRKEISYTFKQYTVGRTKSNGDYTINIVGFGVDEEQAKQSFLGTLNELIENLQTLKHNIEYENKMGNI